MSVQQVEGKCWQKGSIFQSIKVIMEVSLSPPTGPPLIDICNAQNNFYDILGYDFDALPLSLENFISKANSEQDVFALVHAIQQGASHDSFLIVCDADGVDLACHVHVNIGGQFNNRSSKSSADASEIHRDHFSVMTIRSASIVGNVKTINMLVEPSIADDTDPAYSAGKQARVSELVAERIDRNTQSLKPEGGETEETTQTGVPKSTAKAASKPRVRSRVKPKTAAQGAPPPVLGGGQGAGSAGLAGDTPLDMRSDTFFAFPMHSIGAPHNAAFSSAIVPAAAVLQATADLPVLARDCEVADRDTEEACMDVSPHTTTSTASISTATTVESAASRV